MSRKHIVAGLVILAAATAALPAFAEDNPATKLGRGVVNATTGWVEVPKQATLGAQEAGLPGLFGGLFQGLAQGIARTVAGGYEVGSFWAPIPDRYEPVMKPATVFEGR